MPLVCDGAPPDVIDQPIGWAAVAGDGVETTNGGLGGEEVTAASADALKAYAASAEPLIIRIETSSRWALWTSFRTRR
jgi:pectate lyase